MVGFPCGNKEVIMTYELELVVEELEEKIAPLSWSIGGGLA